MKNQQSRQLHMYECVIYRIIIIHLYLFSEKDKLIPLMTINFFHDYKLVN